MFDPGGGARGIVVFSGFEWVYAVSGSATYDGFTSLYAHFLQNSGIQGR